jgi:HEAT repeat protein/uncharacterized integral membrane protein
MNIFLKYVQRIGFTVLLLSCLSVGNNTIAQQEENIPSKQNSAAKVEYKSTSFSKWWASLENNPAASTYKVLVVIIIVCILCLLVLLIWILINRNQMKAREIETQRLTEVFEGLLFDYMTTEQNDAIYKKIARTALSDANREILINQIRELSKSMTMSTGVNHKAKEQLRYLYTHHLHLDKDSIRKIHDRKWHIQVKGFRELAFMDITEANDRIHAALKSKHDILRIEAQLALVRLNKDDPFGFLDQLTHYFTLWEQLNVYELIAIHNLKVPEFSRWTSSPNKTVVIFALRMIQVFKQQQATPQIIECLGHTDRDIRHMAIVVCGELQLRDTFVHLKQMYKNEDYDNCLSIVFALGKMPDEMMLGFLKLVLDKEDDVLLQIEAAKAISKMGEVGVSALVKLMKSEYKNYQIIIRHVLDKRIH